MKIINIPLNIPNALSLYRLFSFPFILIFIFLGHEKLFAFFIWFNLTTDILDGLIARRFNQMTDIGSKIDGLADSGTYILAITGIFVFKWTDFQPYAVSFFIFIGVVFISKIFSLIKFGRFYGYHTYGTKVTGYIHGIFFIVLFVIGFYSWFYYVMVVSGILVFSENFLITVVQNKSADDTKGLYWVLKSRKGQNNL